MRGMFAALGVAAACVVTPTAALAQENVYDPWEGLNRNLFAVHEAVDKAVLEPVAKGYRAITPRPVRRGISNVLRNLRAPVIFVNDVLQGEAGRAGTTAARFGVNTTVGILGIFDPATSMGLDRHDEDFGQTLAVWGVHSGPYLFIPLIGPSSLRDGVGSLVDVALDPFNSAEFEGNDTFRATRLGLGALSSREAVIETIDDIREDSIDPYVSIRTSYGLWRYSSVQNGRHDVQSLPEFEAIPEDATPDTVTTPDTETSPDQTPTPQTSIQPSDPTVSVAQSESSPGDFK